MTEKRIIPDGEPVFGYTLGERYGTTDMYRDMGIDPAAQSYIGLEISSGGTVTERLVKDGVIMSERELPGVPDVWPEDSTEGSGR